MFQIKFRKFLTVSSLLVMSVFFWNCISESKNIPLGTNFYVWKTQPDLTETEKSVFKKTQAQKLYVRFFDVAEENGRIQPRAILKNFDPNFISAEIVPTLFITNESFYDLNKEDSTVLAENIFTMLSKITSDLNIDYNEIQIDCDWTSSTKNNFFFFLEKLGELSQKNMSSTLRLHQIKYKESVGIPPVDKVYVMAYATSNPIENQEENSILDMDLLKDYTANINDYPLDFDIALPLYSWAIVSNHFDRKKLINGISEEDLTPDDFEKKESFYVAKNNVFLGGLYINKGFTVKIEGISPELLAEAKTYFEKKLTRPYHLVYYHLDRRFTNRFDLKEL